MNIVRFFDVYAVNREAHLDGRSTGIIAYFSSEESAKEYGKGKGSWGGNAGISIQPVISIDGVVYPLKTKDCIDLDLIQANYDKKLREETLASLTTEQRRVLGV